MNTTTTTMTNIIIINKAGKVSQQCVDDVMNEDNLYKVASFKTNDHFEKAQIWRNLVVKKVHYDKIVVYGKTVGNAGQENKYDFPPPIDNMLFFGNILIIRYNKNKQPVDLTITEWISIYKSLFGGFEWLGDDDSEDEEDEEEVDKSNLDKYGYEKDGFVVEDYDEEEEDADDEEYDDSDEDDDDSEDDDDDDDEEDEEDSEEEEESELEVSAESELKEEEYFTKIE